MKTSKKLTLIFLMGLIVRLSANNIQVSNVSIASQDTINQTAQIQFDVSWENSWRINVGPSNWDAAWIFIKFKMADYQAPGASSSGTTITTSTTERLRVGMRVEVVAGIGSLDYDTYVTGILNSTQFTISRSPTTTLTGAVLRGTDLWEHAWINNSGHVIPAGADFELGLLDPLSTHNSTTNPGLGGFLYRDANGNGTFTNTGVQLQWDYGSQGVPNNDIVDIKVFAVEMVYVPKGSFNVGGGGGGFISTTIDTGVATLAPSGMGTLGGSAGGYPSGISSSSAPINPDFPNGYNAFFMMKYEVSQGQYVDFLNCLPRNQQDALTGGNFAVSQSNNTYPYALSNTTTVFARNSIVATPFAANESIVFACDLNGNKIVNERDDGEWIACNYINSGELSAYLDWSGLRPMSELEFEKAARGAGVFPIGGEYAWGTTGIVQVTALDSAGRASEVGSDTLANANYGGGLLGGAPYRVGALAYATSTRTRSGAGYYGAMDLSGNLWERAILVGASSTSPARSYSSGTHGNGQLTTAGANDAWNNAIISVTVRGGGCGTARGVGTLRISDRNLANNGFFAANRNNEIGGRGVRTAKP